MSTLLSGIPRHKVRQGMRKVVRVMREIAQSKEEKQRPLTFKQLYAVLGEDVAPSLKVFKRQIIRPLVASKTLKVVLRSFPRKNIRHFAYKLGPKVPIHPYWTKLERAVKVQHLENRMKTNNIAQNQIFRKTLRERYQKLLNYDNNMRLLRRARFLKERKIQQLQAQLASKVNASPSALSTSSSASKPHLALKLHEEAVVQEVAARKEEKSNLKQLKTYHKKEVQLLTDTVKALEEDIASAQRRHDFLERGPDTLLLEGTEKKPESYLDKVMRVLSLRMSKNTEDNRAASKPASEDEASVVPFESEENDGNQASGPKTRFDDLSILELKLYLKAAEKELVHFQKLLKNEDKTLKFVKRARAARVSLTNALSRADRRNAVKGATILHQADTLKRSPSLYFRENPPRELLKQIKRMKKRLYPTKRVNAGERNSSSIASHDAMLQYQPALANPKTVFGAMPWYRLPRVGYISSFHDACEDALVDKFERNHNKKFPTQAKQVAEAAAHRRVTFRQKRMGELRGLEYELRRKANLQVSPDISMRTFALAPVELLEKHVKREIQWLENRLKLEWLEKIESLKRAVVPSRFVRNGLGERARRLELQKMSKTPWKDLGTPTGKLLASKYALMEAIYMRKKGDKFVADELKRKKQKKIPSSPKGTIKTPASTTAATATVAAAATANV